MPYLDDPEFQETFERVRAGGVAEIETALEKARHQPGERQKFAIHYATFYGTIAGMRDGRPDGMQYLMTNPGLIDLGLKQKSETELRAGYLSHLLYTGPTGLPDLPAEQHRDAINIAFAYVDPADKKQALNRLFTRRMQSGQRGITETASLQALLDCGADADADKSRAFADAIAKHPAETVSLLYHYGASFDDALTHMQGPLYGLSFSDRDIERLQYYKAALETPRIRQAPRLKRGNYDI